ncbi:MAG TPA: hypothetical protein VFU81_16535, partial [Thermomicrobiales bacterium]|nr:hypothetical protein [Thermomicrobiales bacterium]
MNETRSGHPSFIHETEPRREAPSAGTLFGWAGAGIVLLGEQTGERWVVARAWREADALTDVRRWSFAAPTLFARQVRRLVLEATG